VDSQPFSNLHSVHMRQTTRHQRHDFHCFINIDEGKLFSRKISIDLFIVTSLSFMVSYCLFLFVWEEKMESMIAHTYHYYQKWEKNTKKILIVIRVHIIKVVIINTSDGFFHMSSNRHSCVFAFSMMHSFSILL